MLYLTFLQLQKSIADQETTYIDEAGEIPEPGRKWNDNGYEEGSESKEDAKVVQAGQTVLGSLSV